MSNTIKKVLLVADYGQNDLAFFEVKQKLYELAAESGVQIQIDIASANAFNTAETAALVAKAADSGKYDVIYHNTAPRKDKLNMRHNGDGEFLAYADYEHNGKRTEVIGVFAGGGSTVNTFTLLDELHIKGGVQKLDCETKGSQFRSRDVFPPHVIDVLKGQPKLLEKVEIPEHDGHHLDLGNPAYKALGDVYKYADEKLAHIDTYQHTRHGDAAKEHITIITGESAAQQQLNSISWHHSGAEIEVLPLKSSHENTWIEAGFAAAQLALNSKSTGKRAVYALLKTIEDEHTGSRFTAHMANGADIITDDLRTLYFARHHIQSLAKHQAGSNQPPVQLAKDAAEWEAVSQTTLPQITPIYIDGYGNLKLAITHAQLQDHLKLGKGDGLTELQASQRMVGHVSVNANQVSAINAQSSFDVKDGDTALSKGSSGWPAAGGTDKGFFTEVFHRGGSAAEKLGYPKVGDYMRIVPEKIITIEPGTEVAGGATQATHPEAGKGQTRSA